ncbi:MAG: DUF3795 domain-containing protein, partial [Lachnospiraceae bacterium]|nr:DUF3795 domain-containing protein [Lachnospiraceae bacterium]
CGLFCETCPTFVSGICDGCLSGHVAEACVECKHGFRDCAAEHSVTWCSQCSGFPCERLVKFRDCHVVNGISHHEHILEYVARQREIGVKAWVEEQEKANACPVCGSLMIWCERTCRNCGYTDKNK